MGIALVFVSISALMLLVGIVVSPFFLFVALSFGAAAYFIWSQNGVDLTARIRTNLSGSSGSTQSDGTEAETKTTDSVTEDAPVDVSQLQERAIDAVTQAETAKSTGQYQQAAEAYWEAIRHLEQAVAKAPDDTEEEFQIEIEEIKASLDAVSAHREQREAVTTNLQVAERSFKSAIARYATGNQTVSRIRFRQARDAFKKAQQTIDDCDEAILTNSVTICFEEEATLPSTVLEDFALLKNSTLEALSAADIETTTELETETDRTKPTVITELKQNGNVSDEETVLLTILSWWYESDCRDFGSENTISRRYKQADYGFDQCI